jgi:uncharacterized membrane protein YkoI
MKKIVIATMIMSMTTGLMGCTSYQIVPTDSLKNNNKSIDNTPIMIEDNNTQTIIQNDSIQSSVNDVNANTEAKYTIEQAKEIALKHANLTSDQVMFGKCVMDYEYGTQSYEIEFYKDYLEYSYEINANTGEILSFEQD